MTRLRIALRIFLEVLREIFDESAYARFLRTRQVPSSAEAYAVFCRERQAEYSRRSRCC
jgi:hypothetical protein